MNTEPVRLKADVVVVGAGPVGLTLAMDVAWRGVEVIVIEARPRGQPPSVKSNHVSARSMEIFRRLGVAGKVRNAGPPADYPNDVAYRTSFLGREITRIPIPCRADRYTATECPDADWPTPEPPHRINQIYLEPVLFEHLEAMPAARILWATTYTDFIESGDSVLARATDAHGKAIEIACAYLVGCDGGRSGVRKAIGATLSGDVALQHVQSSYIRAPRLLPMLREKGGVPAWASFSLNPQQSGNVYAIDGCETWLVHVYLKPGVTDFEAIDRDRAIRTVLGVDQTFAYALIGKEDWIGRRLMVDRMRRGRVFICGDASHLWVPYAGYGMNAGIADAANLAWLLAARIAGWGADGILTAYEAERLPITEQVSHFAMNHAHAMTKARGAISSQIDAEGPEADAYRAEVARSTYDLNVQQYCCAGLNFGYYYEKSPLIIYDDEAAPPYSMGDFTASTAPGARAPHFTLDSGQSLYDVLGHGYTLLRFDTGANVDALLGAANAKDIPIDVLDLTAEAAPDVYRHRLVLVRPDQHIAWRGDYIPNDLAAFIDAIRGRYGAEQSNSKPN
jgi:2-polyprenyl-6-methoxyphenol hydroxylase-like FAD-dependent oxidoreductase